MFVEEFITEPSAEALDLAILRWLTGVDKMLTREFGPVIRLKDFRKAA
jgi:hypothetical protein